MAHDILIVDDEADIRMLIGGVLRDEGYATRDAADTAQALAEIQARQPTLVILDIWLQGSGLEGIEILKQLRAEMPSRSEEHTSELQSLRHLVCRLLLEKKKK